MIYKKAKAKINLNLLVLNKREDGYHNIKSVFQKIYLYDELFVSKIESDDFELETNIDSLNNNENILYKAFCRIKKEYDIGGVKVFLKKRIPMQAGLGGGSTDCASFILAINELFNLNMTQEELIKIGKELGADVVPCLYDGAVIAEGIGEKVTAIKSNIKYYVVVIKPQISFSTKEMYGIIDKEKIINKKDTTNEIVKGLNEGNTLLVANNLCNTFEEALGEDVTIFEIKEELLKHSACASLMTGSGSCVYGIFDKKEVAKKAYDELKLKYELYYCIAK